MILVFGSINIDLVARVSSIPHPGETVLSPGYELLFGGKGANQAVAAARATSGTDLIVAMAGQVGDDEFGRAALANLERNGVMIGEVAAGPEPTGCAFITVEESGENAITVASGANRMLHAGAVDRRFGPDDILVLQMEVLFSESLALAKRARAEGARVVWNFAPAPASFQSSDIRALLGHSDVFVANEHEARSAAEMMGLSGDEEAAAAALAKTGRVAVVLTQGARGAVAIAPDGAQSRCGVPSVQVVDTTGAGDTFVGVLAAEMADGRLISEALSRACLAGSLACEKVGAQPGMPSRIDLERRCVSAAMS